MKCTRFRGPARLALVALVIVLVVFAGCSYLPDDSALSPSGVTVTDYRDAIVIVPDTGSYASVGFLFVPGGLVDPHAYVEPLSLVANQGPCYAVVIAKQLSNLAILSPNASLALLDAVPGVERWAIGGHSLGGVMAANAVSSHRSLFVGLVLEAAYPMASDDLSAWTGPVLSLSAEADGLATPAKIAAAKYLLPATTEYTEIAGGCHAYFGSYGAQDGDGTPTITRAAQQAAVASSIGSFLGGL